MPKAQKQRSSFLNGYPSSIELFFFRYSSTHKRRIFYVNSYARQKTSPSQRFFATELEKSSCVGKSPAVKSMRKFLFPDSLIWSIRPQESQRNSPPECEVIVALSTYALALTSRTDKPSSAAMSFPVSGYKLERRTMAAFFCQMYPKKTPRRICI